jgi:hypothetical protein
MGECMPNNGFPDWRLVLWSMMTKTWEAAFERHQKKQIRPPSEEACDLGLQDWGEVFSIRAHTAQAFLTSRTSMLTTTVLGIAQEPIRFLTDMFMRQARIFHDVRQRALVSCLSSPRHSLVTKVLQYHPRC